MAQGAGKQSDAWNDACVFGLRDTKAAGGWYDEAIKHYDEAIRFDPNDTGAKVEQGDIFKAQRKYNESIKAYDEAILLAPNNAATWSQKGFALNAQGKYDEAMKAFDEAVKLDPRWGYNKGVAFLNSASEMMPSRHLMKL